MNNIYLKFHELKTRKIHEDDIAPIDLNKTPYIKLVDGYYTLNNNIFIGSVDKKDYFAFLRQPEEDIYLEKDQILNLMNNDIIIVEVKKNTAKVKEILKRGLEYIIATSYKRRNGYKYFTDKPLGRNIIVGDESLIVNGSVVKLKVTDITKDRIYANIIEVIGHENDPDIDILKIVAYHNWPDSDWDVLEKAANELNIDINEEKKDRLDLTNEFIMTIDGADAKDLDDAISLEFRDGIYYLGVHIADVSLYVQPNSLIDYEAYQKSTSVYMANKVIPMLPHKLSNDLCSLNPHTEKLTLSCLMEINEAGKVVNYNIQKTVIKSSHRLTYKQVNDLLDDDIAIDNDKIDSTIKLMHQLSEILSKVRVQRGELEFNSEEIYFEFDDKNKIKNVLSRTTGKGEALIESFMLAANETVAFHMEENGFPAIYRIHEKPDADRLNNALEDLSKLNIGFNRKTVNAKQLQKVLKESKGTEKEFIINMTLLRAMMRAKYDKNPLGHFGLAARYYTHFTSPIRRYPDLILHRIIKELVLGENNSLQRYNFYENSLEDIAKHTSTQERVAVDIERDVNKLKSCEYLSDKIGWTFKGQIIQILKSGMFVRLENGIEGFINMRNNYHNSKYEPMLLAYMANDVLYKIGDKIKVDLLNVDMLEYEIDFILTPKNKRGKRK